ncbi:MAG: cell division protein FtsA [Bacteroidales bacterium]|nr:cell division protein FtsA [Bacteroidales bacterium]
MEEKYIASIDLGSSKFGICVARVNGDDVQIVYYKETPSEGIRSSLIANPMKASQKLKEAVREAEQELMIQILQVVVGMPRNEVAQVTASARIDRSNPDDYITAEEVATLKSIALETYPLDNPEKQIIYGAVAQSFSIDDEIQLVEDEVVGTLSSALEGNFKVFVGNRTATTALDKIFNQLGISIAKKYFLPEVVARTVLTDEERSSGVALVDVGAGVTSLAIYHGGIMRYYASIPFGGKAITGDVRTECSISEELAEKIKKRFGACLPGKLASLSEKVLQIRTTEPYKEVPVRYISEIIDCRCREIVDAILYYIQESGLQNSLRSGIVITGGGAELANFVTLVKEMSGYEVRKGYPRFMFSASVGSGVYATGATSAIGMVLAAKEDALPDCVSMPERVVEEEEEMMEVEVTDETPAQNTISDEELASGQTGSLISPEEFGEAVEKEKKKKTTTVKVKKRPGILGIAWTKLKNTALDFYDDENKENTEE